MVHVPMDDDGLIPDALAAVLAQLAAAGRDLGVTCRELLRLAAAPRGPRG